MLYVGGIGYMGCRLGLTDSPSCATDSPVLAECYEERSGDLGLRHF